MRPRRAFNPKRRLHGLSSEARTDARMNRLADKVRYGGNPEHKRSPGDFGLTPPTAPRAGKTLCDAAGLFRRAEALALLREGLRRGFVDGRWNGEGWPQTVWAVTADGIALEAQKDLEGRYHGYPMPEADPFRDAVLEQWDVRCATG